MKRRVVVIGGGLAGSLLCNELMKSNDVILLERGPKDAFRYPQVHFVNKKLAEVNTFCFGCGGTTNLWHNGLIPIKPQDITSQEFCGVLTDVQPFIDQAATALFFVGKSFTAEYEKLESEANARSSEFASFPDGIDCLIYPKKFQTLTIAREVDDFYDVEDINFIFSGREVKAVNFATAGRRRRVGADVVIVSAGAMGTPGILQKIIAESGATFDSVGVGFIDHPMGFVGKVKFKKELSQIVRRYSSHDRGSYITRNAIRIKSECGRYTACVFFRPSLTMKNDLSVYKYKSSLGASKGLTRLKKILSLKILHPDIVAEVVAHLLGINIPSRTYSILFIGEQKRGSNRVFYDEDGLTVDWRVSDEEISIYQKMLNALNSRLADLADEINIKTDITEDWLWSAAHHSCTTPMGDTEDDLIDRDLKLKFCDNVYVCDGSVIQEHSYANTGLAIGQLAYRLVKRISDAG
jgi:hypothetical protein